MRDIVLPRGTVVMLHGAACELQARTVVRSAEIDRYPSLDAFLQAREDSAAARRRPARTSVRIFAGTYDVRGGRVDGLPMLQLWDPGDDSLFLVATVLLRQEHRHEDDVWVRAAGADGLSLYEALRAGGVVEPFAEERFDALGHRLMLRCRLTGHGRGLVA